MNLVAEVNAILQEHGETMTLQREGEGSTITLRGKRLPGTVADIGGSAASRSFG